MPKHPGGRPTDYTPELADLICARLAMGESLVSIGSDKTMPGRSTIHDWLNPVHPSYAGLEFSDKYAHAREDQADFKADEIEDIADRTLRGEIRPDVARVVIDTKKWTASKLRPKRYGDKIDLTTDGKAIQPVLVKFIGDTAHDIKQTENESD